MKVKIVCQFYLGIGMVIGHEITHGFDDEGRQFDKEGNRVPWWSNGTINQFNQRKQCIIDQYSNYTVPQINKHVRFYFVFSSQNVIIFFFYFSSMVIKHKVKI